MCCYVHGWSDYFFQTGLARFFTDRGARFTPSTCASTAAAAARPDAGYTVSLDVYDADIAAALDAMGTAREGAASCCSVTARAVSPSRCGRRGTPASPTCWC